MTWTEFPDPIPGAGEVLVRLGVGGVNYMDTGIRRQGAPGWALPAVLDVEGMGYVTALGAGGHGLAVGARVAWLYHPGSHAELLAIPADSLVKVPDEVPDETAAAVMMQGLTANHFTTETYGVKRGDTAVVHAAAGGVGLLLTQMIKARGGTVIGLVSREEKVAIAEEAGADHVLVWSGGGFEDRVKDLTGGEGAHVVYDGGGSSTFRSSQLSLRTHGVHAYYGPFMAVPSFAVTDLPNSILLSYPTVHDHVRTREALLKRSGEVLDMVRTGQIIPASEAATRWRTQLGPTPTSSRARPPESCCYSPEHTPDAFTRSQHAWRGRTPLTRRAPQPNNTVSRRRPAVGDRRSL